MSRKWSFPFFTRSNAERSRKSRQHLRVESLEGRDLLTTLSVDIGNSGCASDGVNNYCQIQDAIDAAVEGDVIEVSNGRYDMIQIRTDNLTLRAVEGATPTIDAEGALSGVELHADGVTIQGLTVENALVGFDVNGNFNTLTANHVSQIQIETSLDARAFNIRGGGSNTFLENTASDVSYGFLLVNSDANTLENNHVSTSSITAFATAHSDSNSFHHNTAIDSDFEGFAIWTNSHFNVVTENTVVESGRMGIAVYSSSNNTIAHNIVRSSQVGIGVLIGIPDENGTAVPADDNMFVGNIVEGSREAAFGLAEAHSNTFQANVANDNPGDAFRIYHTLSNGREVGPSESNTFQDNIAIGNGGFAFFVPDVDDALANTFENNRCVENASGAENADFDACSLPTAGDANLDGSVDALDLNEIGLNWRQNVTGWRSGDFNADGRVDAADLNALALNWRNDVSGAAAARAPRAPLANRVSVPIAAADDTHRDIVASESHSSPGDRTVIARTDYDLSRLFAKRMQREQRASTHINSRAGHIQQSPEMNEEQTVNVMLRNVARDRWLRK